VHLSLMSRVMLVSAHSIIMLVPFLIIRCLQLLKEISILNVALSLKSEIKPKE